MANDQIHIKDLTYLIQRSAGGAGMPGSSPDAASANAAFLLIGANVFLLTLRAFWDIGLWLENEQRAGTLEMLFLAPCDRRWIVTGIALFNLARGLLNFCLSFAAGCLLFRIDPFQGNLFLALLFMAAGVVPLYALALAYGALVLRFKESDALVQIAQSLLALLAGIYYPVSTLPPLLRAAALLLPPAWITHDMRAALLGAGYILHAWPRDLAVLAGMCLLLPPLANAMLRRTETALRHNGGLREG
jgi:ABC-2 type transport system permease protein